MDGNKGGKTILLQHVLEAASSSSRGHREPGRQAAAAVIMATARRIQEAHAEADAATPHGEENAVSGTSTTR